MTTIGVLYGMEESFPPALVDRINAMGVPDVRGEHLKVGGVEMAEPAPYGVIIDRISHDIPFYRSFLKNAVLTGTKVINNPFWWSADDKFFNYSLAKKLGVAVPHTVLAAAQEASGRHHGPVHAEPGVSARLGRHLRLRRLSGVPQTPRRRRMEKRLQGRLLPKNSSQAYDESGDLCMTLQAAVNFQEYFRCYVINQEKVHVMRYDPGQPHHLRYVPGNPPPARALGERMERDALTLCRALGYDLNTVEFAVEDGIPYAIDFMNPAPDAALESVGPENFKWIVDAVAEMAIARAQQPAAVPAYRWSAFLESRAARSGGAQ